MWSVTRKVKNDSNWVTKDESANMVIDDTTDKNHNENYFLHQSSCSKQKDNIKTFYDKEQ